MLLCSRPSFPLQAWFGGRSWLGLGFLNRAIIIKIRHQTENGEKKFEHKAVLPKSLRFVLTDGKSYERQGWNVNLELTVELH